MTPDETQRAMTGPAIRRRATSMLDFYVHSNPARQAARERWPWEIDERRELPWPGVPAITVCCNHPTPSATSDLQEQIRR